MIKENKHSLIILENGNWATQISYFLATAGKRDEKKIVFAFFTLKNNFSTFF